MIKMRSKYQTKMVMRRIRLERKKNLEKIMEEAMKEATQKTWKMEMMKTKYLVLRCVFLSTFLCYWLFNY